MSCMQGLCKGNPPPKIIFDLFSIAITGTRAIDSSRIDSLVLCSTAEVNDQTIPRTFLGSNTCLTYQDHEPMFKLWLLTVKCPIPYPRPL